MKIENKTKCPINFVKFDWSSLSLSLQEKAKTKIVRFSILLFVIDLLRPPLVRDVLINKQQHLHVPPINLFSSPPQLNCTSAFFPPPNSLSQAKIGFCLI